jgi:alkaline phosphatase D
MKIILKSFTVFLFIFQCACGESGYSSENRADIPFKIAFGSCANQKHPLPIFDEIVKHKPDLFLFLGDNIYGDTEDMDVLRQKYQELGNKPTYQNLKKHTSILATWDDHDYGANDAGKHYPRKKESKEIFLEFFEEPKDSERYQHEGIYHAVYQKVGDKTIQIILLDGRTFRDNLVRITDQAKKPKRFFYDVRYAPHTDNSKTLLGEQQWAWLENELKKPADFRVIASGTQFGTEYNGYETWANFPHEQERLIQLIKKTRAEHLVIVSGDVHYAQISKFTHKDCYPLYDITASGLSQKWRFATPNKNSIEGPVMDNHFGLLTIHLSSPSPRVTAEVWDIRGNQRIEYTIPLQEISFSKE